jgi:peptidoglycan/xylan/chitin deacetylase (PgdA/CDA1 family)
MIKSVCESSLKTLEQFLKKSLYIIAGLPLLHQVGNLWRGRACVLCYHRVLPEEEFEANKNPNSNLIMPTSKFAEQMSYLAENYEVVFMDDLVGHLKGDSKEFVVVVTFDDGYKDNLTHALPILEQYNIPATIYITTRFPEGDTWMWWNEIWDYLENNDTLGVNDVPEGLTISTLRQKIKCFNKLFDWILNLSYEKQKKYVETLTKSVARKQYSNLCLNWEEIKILDQHPLVTIGAHTNSHPNLKKLTEQEAFAEMSHSKNLLEEKLKHSIEHFAYPFGTHNEADVREFELASRCGFRTAVTTRPESLKSPALNAIPRLGVPSYLNLRGFIGKLSGWETLVK